MSFVAAFISTPCSDSQSSLSSDPLHPRYIPHTIPLFPPSVPPHLSFIPISVTALCLEVRSKAPHHIWWQCPSLYASVCVWSHSFMCICVWACAAVVGFSLRGGYPSSLLHIRSALCSDSSQERVQGWADADWMLVLVECCSFVA